MKQSEDLVLGETACDAVCMTRRGRLRTLANQQSRRLRRIWPRVGKRRRASSSIPIGSSIPRFEFCRHIGLGKRTSTAAESESGERGNLEGEIAA